jgi:long-chain acyl-CoA synthetase
MDETTFASVPDMLRSNSKTYKDHLALKYRKQGRFITLTYEAYYNRALMVTRGLRKEGIVPGDRLAILSENRVGWVIADMGILAAGAVTVPIYATSTPEQIEYMLNHSESRIVFVSNKFQYSKLLKIRAAIPKVELVVSFERFIGHASLPVISFYQLSEIDDPVTDEERAEMEAGIDRIKRDDLLTLIYTSGTTGVPKGVMLNHANILFDAYQSAEKSRSMSDHETTLSFLPLSHIFERTIGYYMPIMFGSLMAFADNMDKLPENMLEVRPTVMVAVPRLFEKIYHRVFENVHKMPVVKRWLFHWALRNGKAFVEQKYVRHEPVPFPLSVKHSIGDGLVFKKIRKLTGGNLKLFCSGAAPLDKGINEFFWAIGLPVLEGYGLTETSPVVSVNTMAQLRFGSVGTMLERTQARIEPDGEISLKGPQVMLGYYKDPETTASELVDGWFRTGDVGKIEDGYLFITDRKKELIITAGGKNIAPQPIENELKLDKYITQSCVYGDRKPYLTALIVPNFERLKEYAEENHITYYSTEDLVMNDAIEKLLKERLAEINARLPQWETIKKFILLPRDFSIDDGELTPTLKLRRKQIYDKFHDKIEWLYESHEN